MNSRSSTNPIDRVSVYIAAGLISGGGALMFNVMPVFVGAMADTLSYDESELGDVVAAFNIGFTAVALAAVFWVRKINWRIGSLLAIASAMLGLLGMSVTSTYAMIVLLTGVVGLAMGGLYALVMAVLGDSDHPDRAFGLKLGLETLPGAVLLFLMPAFIVPVAGFTGALYAMAATLFLLGLAGFFLPARGVKTDGLNETEKFYTARTREIALPVLALTSSLVFFTGITASWAFLELLANAKGLKSNPIGTVLAVAFIICGIGGFVAAALGDRYGRKLPLFGIILVNWAGLWMLSAFSAVGGYAVGTCLFLFSVNFALAYTFGLTAKVDIKGQLVVLSAAGLSGGAIIGPATAGRLIEAGGYNFMLMFSASCSLIALLVYLLVINIGKVKD